jgi:thiol-disulfide isomerase/thioredoxin
LTVEFNLRPVIKILDFMKSLSFIFSLALASSSIQASGPTEAITADQAVSAQAKKQFEELKAAVAANNMGVVEWHGDLSEQDRKWNEDVVRASLASANLATQFLEKFPASQHAAEAAESEEEMLLKAEEAGSSEAGSRLDALLDKKLKAPGLNEEDRFKLRGFQVESALAKLNGKSAAEKSAASEGYARQVIAEFPKRSDPYLFMLQTAKHMDSAKGRALVDEVLGMAAAPDEVKQQAESILRFMNLAGHPADIQFVALDGREVDLAHLKGKVVLVDFWATWCVPCVGEIPNIKAAYEQFHSQGFEVVGISFDKDKSALENFVKSKDLAWPQYFDGKGWQNKFGQRYAITSIPAMWLLDRNGDVVDTKARNDLEEKIKRLLAGNETPAPAP